MQRIRVGLSPIWGSAFLAIAVLDLFVYSLNHETLQLLLGLIMGLVGVSYMFGTLLVIDRFAVQLKNPLGMALKTYPYESPDDLAVEGRKLWVTTGGQRRKVNGMLANGSHWRAMTAAIAEAQAEESRTSPHRT